jgi:monoamine oxidase
MTVRARRVVVAVPIAIAGQIWYEPMLPVDRSFLHPQRMPSGAIYKINIVYDEQFSPSSSVDSANGSRRAKRDPAPALRATRSSLAAPSQLHAT